MTPVLARTEEGFRPEPFDTTPCEGAALDDLDESKLRTFLLAARHIRQFPLSADTCKTDLLEHLGLMHGDKPTNAAVLLFGKDPQRFLISSEIRCAHFHGREATRPIPSYQVYRGDVFELVDQAVGFVLGRIDRCVGTREESTRVSAAYEIPPAVVREVIVNAVAHRNYKDTGSIQVMLFSDRLEVWNPGQLSPALTLRQLRGPHSSMPTNRLLTAGLYLTGYLEGIGTGTTDIIRRCKDAGLDAPEYDVSGYFSVRVRRKGARSHQLGEERRTKEIGMDIGTDRGGTTLAARGKSRDVPHGC